MKQLIPRTDAKKWQKRQESFSKINLLKKALLVIQQQKSFPNWHEICFLLESTFLMLHWFRSIARCWLANLAWLFLWSSYKDLTITSPLLWNSVKFLTVQKKRAFRNDGLFHTIYAEVRRLFQNPDELGNRI